MAKRRKITQGSISFILKTNKLSKEGFAPLFLRYSYQGVPVEYSVGKSIHPFNWDDESKEPIYLSKPIAKKLCPDVKYSLFCSNNEVSEIISLMNELELKIKDIETDLKEFSSKEVIAELKGEKPKQDDLIFFTDFMDDYIQNHKGKTLDSTLKVYGTINNMAREFEKTKFRRFKIHEVDYNYIKDIADFMAAKGMLNSTINRRLKHVRGFVSKARKRGYQINPTYQDFTWSTDDTDVLALTMEELKKLEDLDLNKTLYLERTRDVFVFACYTGLRYSDFSKLKKINIKDGFLRLTITKTKSNQVIPLSKKAKQYIDKYETNASDFVFPVASSQKFNEYIKLACERAEINEIIQKVRYSGAKQVVEEHPKHKLVSAHTARKTFVTLSLELGMKAEEIMPITGHKDYKSFKRYVNLTEKRAKEALLSAWDKS